MHAGKENPVRTFELRESFTSKAELRPGLGRDSYMSNVHRKKSV